MYNGIRHISTLLMVCESAIEAASGQVRIWLAMTWASFWSWVRGGCVRLINGYGAAVLGTVDSLADLFPVEPLTAGFRQVQISELIQELDWGAVAGVYSPRFISLRV